MSTFVGKMTFSLSHFEQYLSEKVLKKGLSLFQATALKLIEKGSHGEYHFTLRKQQIWFTKKQTTIYSPSCTCKNGPLCEHLCAALFYLQKDTLGEQLQKKKQSRLFKGETSQSFKAKLKTAYLHDYLSLAKHKKQNFQNPLINAIKNKSEEESFLFFRLSLEALLKPYLEVPILSKKHISEIHKQVLSFFEASLVFKFPYRNAFYLHLALRTTLPTLLQKRFADNEDALKALLEKTNSNLLKCTKNKLQAKEKEAWFQATLLSIKTNKVLIEGSYLILLPPLLSWLKNSLKLNELQTVLQARAYRSRYTDAYNPLLFAQFFVQMRQAAIENNSTPTVLPEHWLEHSMALVNYYFITNKLQKAFAQLLSALEFARKNAYAHHAYLCSFLIQKSREFHKPEIEVQILKERFLFGPLISTEELNHFIHLIPKTEKETQLHSIIEQLKVKNRYYTFEKLASVLLFAKEYQTLAKELKREHHQFKWAQQVVLHLTETERAAFFPDYLRHLSEAMNEARFFTLQKKLLDTAMTVFQQLSPEQNALYLSKLANSLGENSALNQYLESNREMEENRITLPA